MSTAAATWDAELGELAAPSPLLQTWGWGEVQSRAGWTVERVRLSGGALASVQLRGVGPVREAYVPRGPVPATAASIDALVEWARAAKVAKLRLEPEAPHTFAEVLGERGFAKVEPTQPEYTRIITMSPKPRPWSFNRLWILRNTFSACTCVLPQTAGVPFSRSAGVTGEGNCPLK